MFANVIMLLLKGIFMMESLLQIDKLNTGNASLYHKSLYCKGEKVVKVYGLAF